MLVKRTSSAERRPKKAYIYIYLNINKIYVNKYIYICWEKKPINILTDNHLKTHSVNAYLNVKHKKLSLEKRMGATFLLAYVANSYGYKYVLSVIS